MSVASFSAGHVEGAYAMHLRIPQSSSEQSRSFNPADLNSSCSHFSGSWIRPEARHLDQACLLRLVDPRASPFGRS